MMKTVLGKTTLFIIMLLFVAVNSNQMTQAQSIQHFECEDTSYRACYIAWHPEDNLLVIRQLYSVELWDIDPIQLVSESMHEGSNIVVWTPDGTALTTVGTSELLIKDAEDGHIIQQGDYVEWLVDLDRQGLRSSTYIGDIEAMTWNPDGTQLAFISGDYVAIWNVESNTFELVNTPEDRNWSEDKPRSVDWSPDSSTIALATTDQFALIDAVTYEIQLRINYPSELVSENYLGYERLKWSPDGKWVAVAVHSSGWFQYEQPARILLFDPDTGEFEHTFETEARFARSLTWSPNGQFLASANGYEQVYPNEENVYDDNSVRIWDVEQNELVELIRFDSPVYMVDWSADGNYLATSTFDGDIDIWKVALD